MNAIVLPEHLRAVIAQFVAEGRVPDEMAFLEEAVMRYALDLEDAAAEDDDEVQAAADEGIADIAAGRFRTIRGAEGLRELGKDMARRLDEFERQLSHRPDPER